jgi:hypothetical protein
VYPPRPATVAWGPGERDSSMTMRSLEVVVSAVVAADAQRLNERVPGRAGGLRSGCAVDIDLVGVHADADSPPR